MPEKRSNQMGKDIENTESAAGADSSLSPCSTSRPDYFAVYVKKDRKERPRFLVNVLARDRREALKVARAHGLTVPRLSSAHYIGRDGYFASLRAVFHLSNDRRQESTAGEGQP
jgi:hypothetical protein